MKEKINIIQFMPYFPPHKGGVETVGEEIGKYWVKNNFGEFINIVTEFKQQENLKENKKIIFENEVIGYKKDGYEVLVCPSIEIINNFPIYKIWSKKYRLIQKYLQGKVGENKNNFRGITHTRFFLTSLIGGLFARRNGIKWIHIEHGSDYVNLSSKLKTKLSIIYDKIFGKWIFRNANKILAISKACKSFISKEFVDRKVEVFYRGLELNSFNIERKGNIKLVFIGRLVKLKGVDYLLEVYKNLGVNDELIIIGDGEERQKLETFVKNNKLENVKFLLFKNKDFIERFLAEETCILMNPSYQEGLPTTVIEGLFYKNIVIASNVGGTSEISDKKDLILFKSGNKKELEEKIKFAIKNYERLKGLSFKNIKEKFDWNKNILKLYNIVK